VPGAATDPALLAHAVSILDPYDPARWVGKIAPRRVMLINGRSDPTVLPIDALELAAVARDPKTVVYFNGATTRSHPGPTSRPSPSGCGVPRGQPRPAETPLAMRVAITAAYLRHTAIQ
jgi:fermentation-respiration switch protein FrsA (DUF1100 family)